MSRFDHSGVAAHAHVPLFVTVTDGPVTIFGSTLTIAADELVCELPEHPPVGRQVRCTIEVMKRDNASLPVVCDATVMGIEGFGVRLRIDRYDDPADRDNIANLVLFHAQRPDLAARDISRQ